MSRARHFWLLAVKLSLVLPGLGFSARAQERPVVTMGIQRLPESLDAIGASQIEAYEAFGHVVEPLAKLNPRTRELRPWLARRWTVDKKAGTFKVFLRKDVKFHDGQPLTAEAVKTAFDQHIGIWKAIWDGVESATVIDDHTVEFSANPLRYLSLQNVLTSLRVQGAAAEGSINGTGPFRLKNFVADRIFELDPHDAWWGRKSHGAPDFVLRLRPVGDLTLADQLLLRNELDFYEIRAGDTGRSFPGERKVYRRERLTVGLGEGLWITLNLRQPLFADVRVREALTRLWNRVRTNKALFSGSMVLAADGFSPLLANYPPAKALPYDPKKARRLLREAGWIDANKDGVLEKDGLAFRFTILVRGARDERWVAQFQEDAAKAGIKVSVRRGVEDAQLWEALREGRFDAVAGFGGLGDGVYANVWRSDGAYNTAGFNDPKVDALLDRMDAEFDPKKRSRLQRDLMRLVRAAHVQIHGLSSTKTHFFVSKRLRISPASPKDAYRWRSR